jgi:D-tyrosyl-tRNA(Tyr) deacylase
VKAVVQRVARAAVTVDGEEVARIGRGLLVLLGVEQGDGDAEAGVLASKVAKLRVFPDEKKPMNCDVRDVGGEALVVSQFTLAADLSRGNRPSFVRAAAPGEGERLYLRFAEALRSAGVPVGLGRFGAMMDVELVNAGPATFVMELAPGSTRLRGPRE